MATIVLQPGNVRVSSLRILHPWRGVWLADLDIDPETVDGAPTSGRVTISMGTATLSGTIDPRGSGSFGSINRRRVLGGGAGWDQPTPRQHYHSDGVLRDVDIYATTAQSVGETVNVPKPSPLAVDFYRVVGPARQVFDGPPAVDWYVDITGITQVGQRPAAAADPTLTLIRWDPATEVAELTCSAIVVPGTPIADARIVGGPVVARDVEQVFDEGGSRVTAWCGVSPVGQLMNDLRSLVTELSGKRFLATYLYRIVQQNSDGRLQLQAVHGEDGAPDSLPLSPWTGLAGASAKYTPGTYVRVAFLHGDPKQPVVDLYAPGSDLPLESTVDASLAVHVGPSAASVDIAGGGSALVPTPWASGLAAALATLAGSLAGFTTGPLAPLGAVGGALGTALGALPSSATTKTKAT
jgi:hypothetical protein